MTTSCGKSSLLLELGDVLLGVVITKKYENLHLRQDRDECKQEALLEPMDAAYDNTITSFEANQQEKSGAGALTEKDEK
eukprot:CAMPEP_0172527462 /NCGR_PEP_ID=MMETSP1067-20121228/2143_1 /TAXON_ID=265564 ORGANISM="Thalassiosira punctigera, Strain Tpunct2005C2" /NCGR_SAMPLE_ID=MMETSP1067 /ASSEMBLY_ACC=CAM_ASM_000444 /LENGTH=78 /DNA_ID=CAMNT_0013311205 /DNA_START=116 /DNA_END=352 /DNA_ORIENTATION=-